MNWEEKADKRYDAVMRHAAEWDVDRWADWWTKEFERQGRDQIVEARRGPAWLGAAGQGVAGDHLL